MSSSAISAAKRRTETALKNYKIPTTAERTEPSKDKLNDQVLLSLLQSRINWSTNVFNKYRPDAEQQPKRSNVIRRRFPMMRELGQATLELGPHLFYETSFYEAVRSDSWIALGKSAGLEGLDVYEPKPPLDNAAPPPTTTTATTATAAAATTTTTTTTTNPEMEGTIGENDKQQQQVGSNEDGKSTVSENTATQPITNAGPTAPTTDLVNNQTTIAQPALDTTDTALPGNTASDNNDVVMHDSLPAPASSGPNNRQAVDRLVYRDIVIEFKDQPSERYLFPKDVIMQVLEDAATAKFSFMLPLDRTCADCFFWDAKKKLQHFGHQSSISEIKAMATTDITTTTTTTDKQHFQPVNIRLLNASPVILDALRSTIDNPEHVRAKMIPQMQKVPDRSYLDYSLSKSDQQAVHDLIHRVHTQPDIVSGPIAAEKKRNEIGLAIKLGKRPETDLHEAEPPKTKQHIPGKNEGYRRCVYCSTRYTVMWRKGPAGEGTLCNGCGILWRQGKILIGAPVISKEEERQQIKERWRIARRKREQEEWHWKQQRIKEEQEAALRQEQEALHRMELCVKAKKKRALSSHRLDTSPATTTAAGSPSLPLPPPPPHFMPGPPPFPMSAEDMKHYAYGHPPHIMANGHQTGAALGLVAAQIAHQQHQKGQLEHGNMNTQMMPPNGLPFTPYHPQQQPSPMTSASNSTPPQSAQGPVAPVAAAAGAQPSPSSTQAPAPAPTSSSSSSSSYHIFDLPQIPLPTLCIEFSHNTMFSHPHCTVALSHQKQFSIQLTKDNVPIHFHIPRQALATTTQFEILGQLDSAGRDILLMSCTPDDIGQGPGVPLEAFGSVLYDPKDPQRRLNIRFLEKIDALGGPVVKKILECWLAEK